MLANEPLLTLFEILLNFEKRKIQISTLRGKSKIENIYNIFENI